MTVDLEAIARRSDSDLSALKLALPLIEQGFAPPFLARYRRDELGGVGEGALWALMRSIRSDRALGVRREELMKVWQRTRLADSSLEKAIRDAKSKSAISRVARRLKNEPSDPAATIAPEVWVASRILNPEPGDSGDIAALAAAVGQNDHLDQINEGLDRALAKRLAEHPQIQAAAVRWLTANASIRFLEVSDPNIESRQESEPHGSVAPAERPETEPGANWPSPEQLGAEHTPTAKRVTPSQPAVVDAPAANSEADAAALAPQPAGEATTAATADAPAGESTATSRSSSLPPTDASTGGEAAPSLTAVSSAAAEAITTPTSTPGVEPTATAEPATAAEPAASAEATPVADLATTAESTPSGEPEASGAAAAGDEASSAGDAVSSQPGETATAIDSAAAATDTAVADQSGEAIQTGEQTDKKPAGKKAKKAKPIVKQTKVFKKLSPRQRRRRWLIGILQPLVGKQVPIKNLSPFQTMVLSRALRANLVRCQFVYDANQLIAQLRKTAAGLNPAMSERLSTIVAEHEASIREITESVWWDELQDVATNRLVDLTAAHLDAQLHRGAVEAKTVLSLDAVGPRTSPVSIVASDGRLLHTEDIASQLENELRTASVTRLGELIHRFGVDLIVISNGPARRAAMIILGELIAQSPEGSIRWTIAERSGADAYASGETADREMRVTPRRFRAAAWLAFSLLKPAWALAKVDPLKLRLSAAQRELPEELLAPALHDVMSSAVSRGGLDVNAAAVDSLAQLPGVTRKIAEAIDRQRRAELFTSREQLLALEEWPDEMHGRQAIGFLRVFGGDEPLDATVIHPEDYSLARKLAKALNLELPPAAPPGYQPPSFDEPKGQGPSQAADSAAAEATASSDGSDVASQDDHSPFAAELMGDASAEPAAAELAPAVQAAVAETSASDADVPVAEATQTAAAAEATDDATASATEPTDAPQADASETAPSAETAPLVTGRQPLPDPTAINKCIREWQVGSSRAHRLVHALCDPFGEESLARTGDAPAVLTRPSKAGTLRPGDQVIGVVASVAPFGAFVEISPELTGLVRVSRLAEEFVEEIHDFIQVGDVVTAWVTEIDSRRRLQLSALSPEREQELRRQRQEQREHRGQQRRGGSGRGERGGQGQGGQGHGGQAQGAQPRGGQAAGQGRQGDRPAGRGGQGGQGGQGGVRTAPRGEPRHGGRDDSRRGDGRGRDRGGRRDEPISYTTRVSKAAPPAAPITEAMAEGKEPLRSFGDLLQFMKKDVPAAPTKTKPAASEKLAPQAQPSAAEADESQAQPDVPKAAASDAQQAAPESPSPAPPSPGAEADALRSEPTAANDNPA